MTKETQRLLNVKKVQKRKRPYFLRSDTGNRTRVSRSSWRKPRGLHNKIGDSRRGQTNVPSVGFRTPKVLRDTNRDGLKLVRVTSLADVEKLKPQSDIAIIATGVGFVKRIAMLEKAGAMGLSVVGVKDAKEQVTHLTKIRTDEQKQRKEKLKARSERKASKQKVKTQKEAAKEKKEQKATPADAAAQSKKELDEVLTKKN